MITSSRPLDLTADERAHLQQLYIALKVEQARAELARIDPVAAGLRWDPEVLFAVETGFTLPRLEPRLADL